MSGRSGLIEVVKPELSYLICATPRSGSTLLCAALDDTGIAGHPEEHFEVLLETGQPRQPRDYFQRSNDPEVWALLDDPEFEDVLGEYGGRYAEHPASRDPSWCPPDFETLVEEALRKGTTGNGALGTKIMWAYLRDFVRLARRTPGLRNVPPAMCRPPSCPTCEGSSGSTAGTQPARRSPCGRRSRLSSGAETLMKNSAGGVCVSASPP
jgi:Stf0 sulphotransferase